MSVSRFATMTWSNSTPRVSAAICASDVSLPEMSTDPVSRLTVPSSFTLMDAVEGPLPLRHSPREMPTPRPSSVFLGSPIFSLTASIVSIRPLAGTVAPETLTSPSLTTFLSRNSSGSSPIRRAMLSMWDSTAKCMSATPEAR